MHLVFSLSHRRGEHRDLRAVQCEGLQHAPAATTTPRPCLPMAPMLVLGRIGSRLAPHPQRPNRHRSPGTVGASSSRGFLPWRVADTGPRARTMFVTGPASATLHSSRHSRRRDIDIPSRLMSGSRSKMEAAVHPVPRIRDTRHRPPREIGDMRLHLFRWSIASAEGVHSGKMARAITRPRGGGCLQ